MTNLRLLTAFLLVTSLSSSATVDIEGTWQGRIRLLVYSQDMRLMLHISRDSIDQSLVASIEIPDQRMKDIDADIEVKEDSLFLEFPTFKATYSAKYNMDSLAYFGMFKQSGFKLPMKLMKGDADDLVYYRPQKPKEPYPYYQEEVTIINKKDDITLAGTFTRPEGSGKYPVVVCITGSGPENRDETIFGHKPFLVIADYLTRRGIAVLRCDDRGAGKSTGEASGTTEDFANDISAQMDYLKKRKDVDAKQIGLLGHSEGGLIAPLVNAWRKDVAFAVLLAAPAMDLYELLLVQDSLASKADGDSPESIRRSMERNQKVYEYVRNSPDSAAAADSIDLFLRLQHVSDYEIAGTLRMADGKWMRWFIGYDPMVNLRKLRCPVLALNGAKDVQVPAELNIPNIEKALKESGNKNFKTQILPGLNHLFQTCKKCSIVEYASLEETFDPAALKLIGDWLGGVVH